MLRILAACSLPVLLDVAATVHRSSSGGDGGSSSSSSSSKSGRAAAAYGLVVTPANPAAVVARGGPGIPADLSLPAAAAGDATVAGEVAVVVAALERVRGAQGTWLAAQLMDAVVCVGGLLARGHGSRGGSSSDGTTPCVGDVVMAVDGRGVTGMPFDDAVAVFDAAPRDAPLQLARVAPLPLLHVLAYLLANTPPPA